MFVLLAHTVTLAYFSCSSDFNTTFTLIFEFIYQDKKDNIFLVDTKNISSCALKASEFFSPGLY